MKAINKQQALDRLASIEKETAELRKIVDRKDDWTSVVDFESACNRLNKNHNDLFDRWKYAILTLNQINGLMLETCIEAINTDDNGERWVPNWKDNGQRKFYNYFDKTSSGWAVFVVYFSCIAVVGFGFYFESEEKAQHGSKYFKQYYEVWLGK